MEENRANFFTHNPKKKKIESYAKPQSLFAQFRNLKSRRCCYSFSLKNDISLHSFLLYNCTYLYTLLKTCEKRIFSLEKKKVETFSKNFAHFLWIVKLS